MRNLLAFLCNHYYTRASYIKRFWGCLLNILFEERRAAMSSSSRSASPSLANSSDTSRSSPDKDDTASETDERGDEFVRKAVAASPTSTITPTACEQDDAILAASLRYNGYCTLLCTDKFDVSAVTVKQLKVMYCYIVANH